MFDFNIFTLCTGTLFRASVSKGVKSVHIAQLPRSFGLTVWLPRPRFLPDLASFCNSSKSTITVFWFRGENFFALELRR